MKNVQNTLQKKLYSDTLFTYIITAGFAIISVIRFLNFLTNVDSVKIAGENFKGTAPEILLSDSILYLFIAAALFLFSLILSEIHKTGRPFSKKIINKLRTIAFVLIFASIIPNTVSSMVCDFLDADALSFSLSFETINLAIMVFGVVVGLFSEIFNYGFELQENMDSIA